MIAVKLHPESRISTIEAPKGAVGEIVSKRRASQKCWQMPDGRQIVYCWDKYAPVHYLDDYSVDGVTKQTWKEIDPTYYEDMGDHLLFNRMPHTVKVWKNKPGYEITDRQTGKTMSVELSELDDEPWNKSFKVGLVDFETEVLHNGIRLWKKSAPGGPTKFKWRVKESAGESRLRFREAPEAFDLAKLPSGLEGASNEDKEAAKVNVTVLKTFTKDGFDWTETVDQTNVKIDTDIIGQTSSGYISSGLTYYANARTTSASASTTETIINVGQDRVFSNLYYIWRGFLDFDTSGLDSGTYNINLKLTPITDESDVDFDVQIVKQTWQEPLGDYREANYDGCLSGNADNSIWRNTSGISTATSYTSGNLDATRLNISGDTKFSLRSGEDYNNSPPSGEDYNNSPPSGDEYISIASPNHTTTAYRPVLIVTSVGWSGKIWGVENPASIWGIDVANIAKVHGL